MDILTQKRITDNGEGRGYFRNCVEYVYKDKPEPDEERVDTMGYGVCDSNVDYTYEQMIAMKKYYGKIGDNPVMHFMVAFDKKTVHDEATARKYTDDIAAFFKDHQTIAALHKENQGNSLYHAHYIVNSVNGKDGKLYHSGKSELKQLAMHIHEVTGNYCRGYMKKPDEK